MLAVCSLTPPPGWTMIRAGDGEVQGSEGLKRSPESRIVPLGNETVDMLQSLNIDFR